MSGLTVVTVSVIISGMKVQDVTKEYHQSATPGKGVVTYDVGYKIWKHQEEIKMADWLHGTFGGDIRLLAEADALGVKMPDFNWRGRLWELKTTTTLNATDHAVRKALKQIQDNPGGIILDYADNKIDIEALTAVINNRIARGDLRELDVLMLDKCGLLKAMRYKK